MILKNRLLLFSVFIIICLTAPRSYAEVKVPARPYNYVVDSAGIINDNMEADLNRYLLELEQKTTAQMVVFTIPGLEGESIEDLSISIANDKWRLGNKDKDNGLLLIVALQDKKYRFETGYGLEGILPDSRLGTIGREYLVPYFKKGDYSSGIFLASLAVINEISSDAGVEITGMPKFRAGARTHGRTKRGKPTILSVIFSILFFIGLIYVAIKHPRLFMFFLIMSMMGGGRRSGWSGGGGFGGGGGGGFGGGGASGGW